MILIGTAFRNMFFFFSLQKYRYKEEEEEISVSQTHTQYKDISDLDGFPRNIVERTVQDHFITSVSSDSPRKVRLIQMFI